MNNWSCFWDRAPQFAEMIGQSISTPYMFLEDELPPFTRVASVCDRVNATDVLSLWRKQLYFQSHFTVEGCESLPCRQPLYRKNSSIVVQEITGMGEGWGSGGWRGRRGETYLIISPLLTRQEHLGIKFRQDNPITIHSCFSYNHRKGSGYPITQWMVEIKGICESTIAQ